MLPPSSARPELGPQGPPSARLQLDRLDRLYARLLLGLGCFVFLLWAQANLLGTAALLGALGLLVASAAFGWWCLSDVPAERPRSWPAHLALHAALGLTAFHWLEPVLRFPRFPVGTQFKDLHDGMVRYLLDHGAPPVRGLPPQGVDIPWVTTDMGGAWSAYANAMHCLGAFLAQLGFPAIHALAGAMLVGALATSYATYLVIKALTGRSEVAALIGGLVTLTSFRVPLAFYITAPQGLALALVLPALWAWWLAEELPSWRRSLGAALLLGALAVSYNGTIVVVLGGIAVVSLARLVLDLRGERPVRGWVTSQARTALVALPVLALGFLGQGAIYWVNTFGSLADDQVVYDPTEMSHFLLPFERPLYLVFLLPALWLFVRRGLHRRPLGALVLGFALLLSSTLPWDWAIHARHPLVTLADHHAIPPHGPLGGAYHQKISRVALLQPLVFAGILGALGLASSRAWVRWGVGGLVAGLLALTHLELPLYRTVEVLEYDLVSPAAWPVSAAQSDYVFARPPDNWNDHLQDAIEWLDANTPRVGTIAYLPGQATHAARRGWMGVFLRRQILSWDELAPRSEPQAPRTLAPGAAELLWQQRPLAVVLDQPTPASLLELETSSRWSLERRIDDLWIFRRCEDPGPDVGALARALWSGGEARIELGSDAARAYLGEGWSPPHDFEGRSFLKLLGERASLWLPFGEPRELELRLVLRRVENTPPLVLSPWVGGSALEGLPVPEAWGSVSFRVPAERLQDGLTRLELRCAPASEALAGTREAADLSGSVLLEALELHALGAPWSRSLTDAFDVESGVWALSYGDWQRRAGVLEATTESGQHALRVLDVQAGGSYSLEARFRSSDPRMAVGFVDRVRAEGGAPGARLVQLVEGGLFLRWGPFGPSDGSLQPGGTALSPSLNDGRWHTLRLEVYGRRSIVRLDGVQVATIDEEPPAQGPAAGDPPAGALGLLVSGSSATFDDVRFERCSPAPPEGVD